MATQLSPLPVQHFVDNNGNALVGGQLYTYLAGTSTPQATYTDSTGGTPNTNPIVLNARGECNLWLPQGLTYKFVLLDASSNTIWTVDNVTAPPVSNTVSIKTFGAKGDGVADDTVPIQAALNSGQPLFAPAGTYITGPLNLPSGTVLNGAGRAATIFKRINNAAAGTLMGLATNATNITLAHFTLDGNKANNTNGFCLSGTSVSNLLVEDVTIQNDKNNGGFFATINPSGGSQTATFRDVMVQNCAGAGVSFNGAHNVTIVDCVFLANTGGGAFFSNVASDGIEIRGNRFIANGSHGCSVVATTSGNPVVITYTTTNVTVSDNYSVSNVGYGIIVEAQLATVHGNVCSSNGLNGGGLGLSGLLVTSDRVSITGNTCNGNAGDGIDMGATTEFACAGNMCANNGYYGIEVDACYQGSVTGNTCTNNFTSNPIFTVQCGIYHGVGSNGINPFANQPDRVTITGNTVEIGPFQTYGIYVDTVATYCVVSSNNCQTAGQSADIVIGSPTSQEYGNVTRWSQGSQPAPIASAASIQIPDGTDYLEIGGTTNISQLSYNATRSGRMVTFLFQGALTLVNNAGAGGMILAGNVNATLTAFSIVTFRQRVDGKWYEQSRAIH